MTVKFLENAKVIYGEEIETNFFGCSLLDHVENGAKNKGWNIYHSVGDALHNITKVTEWRIKHQSTYLICIHISEHNGT